MCGLAGIVGRPHSDPERSEHVRRMTQSLIHRGPDGEAFASCRGCDLGFRRLAIIDPLATASTFANEDESIWSVCNGEIYNADEIRTDLERRGHTLRTRVDTEIIPHLFEEFGSGFVGKLDGMFSLAVWDDRRSRLVLARDRAGEKPLFFWSADGELAFASEIRALLEHPRVRPVLNPAALQQYLLLGYFPAPATPLQGVHKLPAGHLLTFDQGAIRIERYWDLKDYLDRVPTGSESDLVEELDERIGLAVRRRRRSDAPVGVFLSGGLDSSTILSHAAEQIGPGVPAFALGHKDRSFDESRFAVRIARHFEADYHELVLDESDLESGLAKVARGMDEPLADASIIPTHLLALFARQQVKVVLSGEGGDELFGGYPTYVGDRIAETYRSLPAPLRRSIAGLIRLGAPVRMGNIGLDYLAARFLSAAERDRLERHEVWFGCVPPDRHAALLSSELAGSLEGVDPFQPVRNVVAGHRFRDGLSELLYTDFSLYLPDDLLTKVDRTTMLASLEARAPFLDHELVEFVAGLPSRLKVRGAQTKVILRQATRHRLPREVLTRRKRGFNIPFSRWLLHGLGERLALRFAPEKVDSRGLFAAEGVMRLLAEHRTRKADHRRPLFALLAFDLWCDRTFGEGARVPIADCACETGVTFGGAA